MSEIKGFHAHVYYDAETKPKAAQLRETIIGKFKIEPGAFSDEPRGPHPISQFNVIFENSEFQNIVPWLMLNRDGLDVLVHPLTESSYDDHSKNALWLGTPVPMRSIAELSSGSDRGKLVEPYGDGQGHVLETWKSPGISPLSPSCLPKVQGL